MRNVAKIDQIFKITKELSHIKSRYLLLDRFLKELMDLLGADAGSVYSVKNRRLTFEISKNNTLREKLSFGHYFTKWKKFIPKNHKSIAGYVADSGLALNIKDVYALDENQPYGFDKSIDEETGYRTCSVLTLPFRSYERGVVGVLQLINSIDREGNYRNFDDQKEQLAKIFIENLEPAIHYTEVIEDFTILLCELIHQREPRETYNHARRVASIASELYKNLTYKQAVPSEESFSNQDKIMTLAMLHDVNLLEGKVENQESLIDTLLKINSVLGRDREVLLGGLKELVLNYREAWNGSGIPGHINYETGRPLPGYEKEKGIALGKREGEIPLISRIIAVAHNYDYLMHYLDEQGEEKVVDDKEKKLAVGKIMAMSGTILDPKIVSVFASSVDSIEMICEWV